MSSAKIDDLVKEGDSAAISRTLTAPLPRDVREQLIRRLVLLELEAGRLERLPGLLLQLPLEEASNQALLGELRTKLNPAQTRQALGLAMLMESGKMSTTSLLWPSQPQQGRTSPPQISRPGP